MKKENKTKVKRKPNKALLEIIRIAKEKYKGKHKWKECIKLASKDYLENKKK